MGTIRTITKKAFAKINLTLDVQSKRPDGYHEIASVMQTVGLYDILIIETKENPGILLTTNSPGLPAGEGNLAYQAAQLLVSEYNIKQGVSIELRKYIPIASGLGGGSSDCAAVLHGVNELLGLKVPLARLLELGRRLGADVPFCLVGGTAQAEGIGERITPLPPHPTVSIVLARLPVLVSTKEIYAKWHGQSENQTPAMTEALKTKNINRIAGNLANDLAPIVAGIYPEILELITAFRGQNALGVSISGSGPTVFAYFAAEAEGLAAIRKIGQQFPNCEMYSTQPINCNP